MEGSEDRIREGIELLIKDSCAFKIRPSEEFQKFQKAFLKFSFGVLDVELDYKAKTISTWGSKPTTGRAIELRNFDDALHDEVNYVDLEETLLGCIKPGVFNERFYKHLLYDFDRLPNEDGMKTA